MIKHLKIHDKDGRPCFVEVDAGGGAGGKKRDRLPYTHEIWDPSRPGTPIWQKILTIVGMGTVLAALTIFIVLPIVEFLFTYIIGPIFDKLILERPIFWLK